MGRNAGYTVEKSGNMLTVYVSGEIDHHSAVRLRRDIDSEIMLSRPGRLILNFKSVTLMDSSGLGFIMGRYNLMRELDGDVIIESPDKSTERIIRIGGIEKIVPIVNENIIREAKNGKKIKKT